MQPAPAQPNVVLMPGCDSKSFDTPTHDEIANKLSQLYGLKYKAQDVAPVEFQKDAAEEVARLMEEPRFALDISGIKTPVMGADEVAPSSSFLQKFLGRLKKQHPDAQIVEKQ